jgi:DNA-binding CsgD family transcriptional regulator
MGDRKEQVLRLGKGVAAGLRSPSVRRTILWTALVGLAFAWGVIVLGIAVALAERTPQWWVVLVFGLVVPVSLLALAYLLRGWNGHPVGGPEDRGLRGGAGRGAEDRSVAEPARLLEPLSDRELEVLELLATGRTNSEMAGELYVAKGTVKAHLNSIFRKLGARNRLEAVAQARELRLIRQRPPQ